MDLARSSSKFKLMAASRAAAKLEKVGLESMTESTWGTQGVFGVVSQASRGSFYRLRTGTALCTESSWRTFVSARTVQKVDGK